MSKHMVVPIVVDTLGTMDNSLKKWLDKIDFPF